MSTSVASDSLPCAGSLFPSEGEGRNSSRCAATLTETPTGSRASPVPSLSPPQAAWFNCP